MRWRLEERNKQHPHVGHHPFDGNATRMAKLMAEEKLSENPFKDSIAAVSVGIYEGTPVLDLPYIEDKEASVDCNVVMTGKGQFVEIQGSGEEATFSEEELQTSSLPSCSNQQCADRTSAI